MTFEEDLKHIINKHGQENESGTPDFILAEYLIGCLNSYNRAITDRNSWAASTFEETEAPPQADAPCPTCAAIVESWDNEHDDHWDKEGDAKPAKGGREDG